MTQLSLFEPAFWTITELTLYLRDILESDPTLQDLWVQGEVSNLSRPASGHLYFTLKDNTSALKCVMWRNTVLRQSFIPRDGQAIEAHGSLNIYEASGQYQLYADLIRPVGEGALYQEFLRLKARLEAEGLFDTDRKRPLPRLPRRIGIVTSPTGAALQDMLNTLRRRYPLADLVLAPTPVQGDDAPPAIVAALQALNETASPDVILLARGGGSIEDLWAFNDERVARAVAASYAPVICGVGHETDFTIADFVADLRAPTPTAAAELATPSRADLQAELTGMIDLLEKSIQNRLELYRRNVDYQKNHILLHSPIWRIRSLRQQVDEFTNRGHSALEHSTQIRRAHLTGLQQRLTTLSPLSTLDRGFAIVTLPDGRFVRSVTQIDPGNQVNVRLSDGQIGAEVLTVTRRNP
jgi:exodeoxyribonuclease VII large subunit